MNPTENRQAAAAVGPEPQIPAAAMASRRKAFTLIELLVVMGIIAGLVSLLFPILAAVNKKKKLAVAQAEIEQVQTAIETYKSKLGFYPPDNPGNPVTNQLYFELEGTLLTNIQNVMYYSTLDGSTLMPTSSLPVLYKLDSLSAGVGGFANCTQGRGGDESAGAVNCLTGLRPDQIGQMSVNDVTNNALLVSAVRWQWDKDWQWLPNSAGVNPHAVVAGLNPICYVSSNPTNNPGRYDLWIDIPFHHTVYRVSNWSRQPQVVPPPIP